MAINREKIRRLVELFYQPTFKTFFINSVDFTDFCKPMGIFVSLGMTTSLKSIEEVKNAIANTSGYNATIVEISSKKESGQFMNTIISSDNIEQYRLVNFPDTILTEEEARKELDDLKSLMSVDQPLEVLKECAPKISKLEEIIDKLTISGGWDNHLIQKEGKDYKIFHQLVNYKKVDNIEYRIGIYVTS